MLNILEVCVPKWAPGQTLASLGPANPKYWHLFVEAKKAFLHTEARGTFMGAPVKSHIRLDPWAVSAGATFVGALLGVGFVLLTQRLLGDHEPWLQRVQVPASVGNLLEFRLGQSGRDDPFPRDPERAILVARRSPGPERGRNRSVATASSASVGAIVQTPVARLQPLSVAGMLK